MNYVQQVQILQYLFRHQKTPKIEEKSNKVCNAVVYEYLLKEKMKYKKKTDNL